MSPHAAVSLLIRLARESTPLKLKDPRLELSISVLEPLLLEFCSSSRFLQASSRIVHSISRMRRSAPVLLVSGRSMASLATREVFAQLFSGHSLFFIRLGMVDEGLGKCFECLG